MGSCADLSVSSSFFVSELFEWSIRSESVSNTRSWL